MKFQDGYRSQNVEDRRGQSGGGGGRRGGIGLAGLLILGVLSLIFKRDLLSPALDATSSPATSPSAPAAAPSPEEERLVSFVSFALDDMQTSWTTIFAAEGKTYRPAQLVLFTDSVDSACGNADASTGPFYCPGDQKAYIDLGFYRDLQQRFGAPGDFAQAYVLAHEIGHHVQNLLGIEQAMRSEVRADPSLRNAMSVRLELQADCFAGIWARSTAQRQILDAGDVEEAMRAAQQIGDDTLQRGAGRRVRPESFTHGSSAQRMRWFRVGYDSGRIGSCNTFDVPQP